MFYKTMVFPARQPGGLAKMLNEQAALGFEFVQLYAENPNRPQHLTVLFKAKFDPTASLTEDKGRPVKPHRSGGGQKVGPGVAEEVVAETVKTTLEEAPKTEEPAAKAPVKSKPGARRGRRAAVKKD